jgi:hypothetical protein
VTIAIRPSASRRDAEQTITYSRKTEGNYFRRKDWTAESPLNPLANFDLSRTPCCNIGAVADDAAMTIARRFA